MQDRVARLDLVDVGEVRVRLEHEVAVRQHRALRHAGRAARIEKPRGIVRFHIRCRHRLNAQPLDFAHRRGARNRRLEIRRDEAGLGGAVLQDVGELLRMELGIHRHGDEPGVPASEQHLVVLDAVLHCQGDTIARLQVQLLPQPRGKARDTLGELAVGAHEVLALREGGGPRLKPRVAK